MSGTSTTGPWTSAELTDKLDYLNESRAYDVNVRYEGGVLKEVRYTSTGQRGRKIITVLSTDAPDRQEQDTSDL